MGIIGDRLLLTLWVGSLWAIGYIAVPLAFVHFDDNVIAGAFAGRLFGLVDYVGIACGTVLLIRFGLLGQRLMTSPRFLLTLAMLALVLVMHFYLKVEMADIKLVDWRDDVALSARFDFLHHLSTALYMIVSVLGLALVATQDSLVERL